MFRLWCKIVKENKTVKEMVIENPDATLNRTRKVFDAIDKICYEYNLGHPIWLESSIADFKRYDKTRFYQDHFIDTIDFDFMEIHVIEEDF